MTPEKAFNNKIKEFLKDDPNSAASKTIRKMEKTHPTLQSYYRLFDRVSFKLGIGMCPIGIDDEKTDITIGYLPYLRYYPFNILNEKPRDEQLEKSLSPVTLNDCYSIFAKELLYRIMNIRSLNNII